MTQNPDKLIEPTAPFNSEKVIGNILALGSSEILARVVAFITTTYLARVLGPAGFGIIGFAAAICAYLSLAVNMGFTGVGAREVARKPDKALVIAASCVLIRLIVALVSMAVLSVVVLLIEKPAIVKLVIILTGLSFFSLALDTSWVYKGLERNRTVGFALVFGQILYLITVLITVANPEDVKYVPLAQFFGETSAAIFLAVSLFRFGEIRLELREGWRIVKSSAFLVISKLLRTLIFTFDVVIIGFLLGEREVGLYNAPYRICFLLLAIATVIQVSYLPAVTRALEYGKEQVERIVASSISLSSVLCFPIMVGGIILSEQILRTVFGAEYLEGAWAFRLLIISIGINFIYKSIHNILLVYNLLRTEMWITALAAGVNVILNIILIPRYGIVAAASVTVLADSIIFLMMVFVTYRIGIRLQFWNTLRPLAAAGIMGASLFVLGIPQSLFVSVPTGFLIYVIVLAIIGGIPKNVELYLSNLMKLK